MAYCSTSPPRRLRTIAADPKHLGARIGTTLVLHTWGSALTHHPHVHGIVPGGGLAPDADRWVAVQARLLPPGPGALTPVPPPLPRRTRRTLIAAGTSSSSASTSIWPTPMPLPTGSCHCDSASGSSTPSARSQDLSRFSPISRATPIGSRSPTRGFVALDDRGVTFRWKDYREHGRTRYKTMTLKTDEFMRRFLLHVLPSGFHRIRHYGLLANANRKYDIAAARDLLHQPAPPPAD